VIPELTQYWIGGGTLSVAALLFTVWMIRSPARRRPYLVPMVLICVAMAGAYFAMANEILTYPGLHGRDVPMARFVGYVLCFPLMATYIGVMAGASRRLLLGVVLAVAILLGLIVGAFMLANPESMYSYGGAVLMLVAVGYIFLRPLDRAAGKRPGELALLFGKLRNLAWMLWFILIGAGGLTRHAAGLLDTFTGVFIAAYIEVILVISFAAIVFRSPKAVDQLAKITHSPIRWPLGIERSPTDEEPST
jgi:bacteriorhodopsin